MMAARTIRYLLKPALDHLQGRHTWMMTLTFSVVGLTYLYRLGLQHLPTLPAIPAIMICVSLGVALLTWQIAGTLKAIKYNLLAPSDTSAAAGGYLTIFMAVVLVGLAMADGAVRHLPHPEPTAARSGPTFDVSYDAITASAGLTGELNYASKAALEDLLDTHTDIKTVVLNSIGGLIFAARPLAKDIRKRGLNTHVTNQCYSACTIVFMAGKHRTVAKAGTLGFHRYGYSNQFLIQTIDPKTEQDRDLEYFRSRGVSQDFLGRIFTTAHDDIWRPDHATLRAASVITEPTQPK